MELEIQQLSLDDIPFVSLLINKAFTESVAFTLTSEGIANFKSGITPEAIKERHLTGNIFVICRNKTKDTILGIGEIRDTNHLNLLFVEPDMQRKGIGRNILQYLVKSSKCNEITVNSSLNAIQAYKRLGFEKSGPQGETNGIKFQPMIYVK